MDTRQTFLKPYSGKVYVPDQGVSPEVMAFAMSRFSRSADDFATSLRKVLGYKEQRVAGFFLDNYHGYGHASIADQGHVAFSLEGMSMLAIFLFWQMIELVDGQERSSRYQPFGKTGFSFYGDASSSLQSAVCTKGFEAYQQIHGVLVASFEDRYPDQRFKDEGGWMDRETLAKKLKVDPITVSDEDVEKANRAQADRIRNARAFDIARYLLPLSTNTSAAYLMSARTAEDLISRLLVHPLAEMQFIGAELKHGLGEMKDAPIPNLLQYADANPFHAQRAQSLQEVAAEFFSGLNGDDEPTARLYQPSLNPLLDIAARLIYPHHRLQWNHAMHLLLHCGPHLWNRILDEGGWTRRQKENFPRDSRGGELTVELVMDIGAARDMNRHRGCFKQYQIPSFGYLGFSMGDIEELSAAGLDTRFRTACETMLDNDEVNAIYTRPLATIIRAVYHMSWAQFIYMTELRSTPAGHFAYRQLTQNMVDGVQRIHPLWHEHLVAHIGPDQFRFTKYELENFFIR